MMFLKISGKFGNGLQTEGLRQAAMPGDRKNRSHRQRSGRSEPAGQSTHRTLSEPLTALASRAKRERICEKRSGSPHLPCRYAVIASEAKQSRAAGPLRMWRIRGWLRFARNDRGGDPHRFAALGLNEPTSGRYLGIVLGHCGQDESANLLPLNPEAGPCHRPAATIITAVSGDGGREVVHHDAVAPCREGQPAVL